MAEVLDRVKNVVVDKLKVQASEITPDSNFIDDLGADSLDVVDLVIGLKTNLISQFRKMNPKKSKQ